MGYGVAPGAEAGFERVDAVLESLETAAAS